MRVGIDCSRLLWVLSLFFATSLSYGRLEVRYPPSLPTSQAQQAYILELMHEFPWLASLGVANSLPQYVALQQTWLQNFYALPEFQTSKGITRQSLSIKVQTVHFEKKAIKVLSNEELGNIRNEVKEILHSDIRLHREIKEKIELLRNTDPRKVIIGLISLLPAQDRVVLFNLPVLKQIDAIAANGKINDQSIAEGFQPEAHNLSTADLSKTNILE